MARRILLSMMFLLAVAFSQAQPQLRITSLDGPNGLNHNKVTDIVVDHRGLLWVSTWAGIYRYDGYSFTHFFSRPGDSNELANPRLDALNEDMDGNLWCRSYDRFYTFDVNTQVYKDVTELGEPKLRRKRLGGEFYKEGYRFRIKDHELSYYDQPTQQWKVLVGEMISTVIDDNGILWVIPKNGGLQRIEVCQSPYDISDKGEHVLAQLGDHQGNIWQGFDDGAIAVKDNKGNHRGWLNRQGTIGNVRTKVGRVYCMAEKKDGTLFLGTRGDGLLELKPKGNSYTLTQYLNNSADVYSLSDNNIYSLLPQENFVLVGTYTGGLNVMEGSGPTTRFYHGGNACKNFPPADRMHCVRSLAQAGDVFVMGTSSGLYTFRIDTDFPKVRFYYSSREPNRKTSLASNEITAVNYLPGKGLFVSTDYSGVCRLISQNLLQDNLEFTTWNTDNDAPSNRALGVFSDTKGRPWVLFNDAISQISADFMSSADYLTDTSGYQQFTNAHPVTMGDGRLLLGSTSGSVAFCPDSLRHAPANAPIVITSVKAKGKPIAYAVDSDTIILKSGQRDFSLEFAALYLGTNDKVEYAYRMEEEDSTWILLGSERTISFFGLSAGPHKIYVRATNNDRVWGQPKAFTIIIRPTFWETPWAWLLYALLALLLITAVILFILYIYRLRMNVAFEKRLTNLRLKYFTDISHDLRTPLTLIEGPVTEMLADDSISEKNRGYLNLVHHNAQRMLTLVNQILDFRKIQSHKMHLLIERMDLKEELNAVMSDFKYLAADNKINFTIEDKTQEATFIWGDKDKIQKIFFNLLSNAFKYTPEGHRVWLELNSDEQSVSVDVCDTGKGIPQNVISKLFARFETLISDNYMKSSTGIGLALVKELVELHHARLQVESQEGEGSRFRVIFQRGNAHFGQDENTEMLTGNERHQSADMVSDADEAEGESIESQNEPSMPSILVVEDDAEMLAFVCDILSKEYRITQAVDGHDGLSKATTLSPDLIITDINMPRMNGWQMTETLRQIKETCHIPVVMLTANNSLDDRIRGAELGVDDYIAKPFSTDYLRMRMRSILKKQHEMQQHYMDRFAQKGAADVMNVELPSDNSGVERRLAQIDTNMMQRLRDFMEEHLSEVTPIQELAQVAGMSRTLFYNKIRSITGQTPIDFYRKYHVERAAQLMRSEGLTVSEACYATGFTDPKYFTKVFKKFMGITPNDYRNGSEAEPKLSADESDQ